MEFIIRETFYNRRHFHNVLKEFTTVKVFQLQHIKTDSRMVMIKCRHDDCIWCMQASTDNGAKSFTVRKFLKECTCSMPGSPEDQRQLNPDRIALIMKYRIARHPGTMDVIGTDIQRDLAWISVVTIMERERACIRANTWQLGRLAWPPAPWSSLWGSTSWTGYAWSVNRTVIFEVFLGVGTYIRSYKRHLGGQYKCTGPI